MEIGGGYGNLTNKMLKTFNGSKCIIVDLPEVLIMQEYYIKTNNPNIKIITTKDLLNSNLSEHDFDVALITPWGVDCVDVGLDLVINQRSFGEMSMSVIDEYMGLIQTKINDRGLFYCVNRYVTYRTGSIIKLKDFNFDNNWIPLVSKPQWLQTHLHEFLLQRSLNGTPYPMNLILDTFPNSSPPPGPITKDYDIKSWSDNNNFQTQP